MKITEKLLQAHKDENAPASFSFEFFTPKTSQGVQNLYDRMDRMYQLNPLFIDITWNAGGRLSNLTSEMVNTTSTVLGLETCMHLTCTNMPLNLIDDALQNAYNSGCQNILALRGDPPLDGSESTGDFKFAKDLINHIKNKFGNHFCIGVAGYPEGHPEEPNNLKTLEFLKIKQDEGADFIVTQLFYDVENFINWCKKCRDFGINIPIIPGIMPISNYNSFIRRAKWNNVSIPNHFIDRLDPIKDDDLKVRDEGCLLMTELCQTLLNSKFVNHLHFYTMNLEKSSTMLLDSLNLLSNKQKNDYECENSKPWRKSLNPLRESENVRPIFWKNRKFSYIQRTNNWDEFPNGRWGDSRSPAFGNVDMFEHNIIRHSSTKILSLWNRPTNSTELGNLLIDYLNNKIHCLPWSDTQVTDEINSIKSDLIDLNSNGIITINSQPRINGIKSTDKIFGWGPSNGYVYQKQYLEFLLPKLKLNSLLDQINLIINEDGYDSLNYFITDSSSNNLLNTNIIDSSDVNAVTWGCFPGREIAQPTIVEKVSFLAWKDELYLILKKWSNVLLNSSNDLEHEPENDNRLKDLKSSKFIDSLISDYVLVNIVDNDYVNPTDRIFTLIKKLY
ncbi:hypothetical protein C6P40_002492 [Pichia californica]|uniref:MTHFR SAM-binding regulatory domain-containing protein n=1 Tax=Pichia californica TaxID=460514 RepID=A0A9P6WHN6_9ASCO|nr:hypothetical protein C6P42_002417 [[Candida] californica]KAG0687336.1 hypothetical protein C6P40_002492 [[Candida] californica]